MRMYFVDDEHRKFFELLLKQFPVAQHDKQYRVACYIVAHPEIYRRVSQLIEDSPMEWYFDWKAGEIEIDFSSGFRKLLEAAAHLWNGDDAFSLYDALHTWDKTCFNMFVQAIIIAR
ncbi:hypothetical protein GFC29_3833 (plasmid) [Anoxybacillus sp. B7M1]|uniref:DUF2538 family protein n=1 Tax=Anoxybacillus sp. B7M1 TaxID=1490057 RepID=UPI0005CCD01A|nr:DUF2538 family protein [Anoxybacillus sp. B7M1]ANB66152.1 hypothetical protein GFC29_3833 [Anoxybacillus sp. B7M1]